MTVESVTEQLTGVIPVVVTGGVVMKFTEGVFGNPLKTTVRRRRKSKRSRRSSSPIWK